MYQSTKHYGHDLGLSACFRQWRAKSHCCLLHGYALAFTFVFEANQLNENGWVIDFGGLGALKEKLREIFDHNLLVAVDDPCREEFLALDVAFGIASVVVMKNVGCEAFAKLAHGMAETVIEGMHDSNRVRVVSCRVQEHGANSAIYYGEG